jgi:eukaryotic-like serine/threonine-protein kinase
MLDDKYRIERLLASGGMGAVYMGTHIKLRKRVAIKVLNPQLSSSPMIERFHREAITASQIGHEGIAQVTDIGTSHEGEPFLVMEYLEGESLAQRLRASGPLAIEDACELGCAILSPLAAAHRAGIVHRDLKPDNVFLVRQSRGEMVKLLDFGISRSPGLDSEFRLTSTGLVLGTPYYMSPEQARGESDITPAADLYAFGVILYEMLVGDVPIRAENYNQLMYRVTIGDYERPRERRPELPEELEQIILHAMAQLPANRPASAADLEQALLPYCRLVFREHASGRLSAPGLALKTPPYGTGARGSSGSIDPALFAGPTMSDERPDDLQLRSSGSAPVKVDGKVDDRPESSLALTTSVVLNEALRSGRGSLARRILIGGAIVVGGAAIAGALVFAFTGGSHPPVAVTPPPIPEPGVATGKPPATPPERPEHPGNVETPGDKPVQAPATITLRFAIDPPGSVVTLDDTRVRETELVVPKDDATHRLRITAAGYVAHDETISFTESQRLVVQLKRVAGSVRVVKEKDPHKDHPGTERPQPPELIESTSPYQQH